MTRDEYEKAIASFLLELQGTMSALKSERLCDSVDLLSEIEEFRIRMGDPKIENADLIGFCFGIVDEYLKTFWKETISDGFDLYRDSHLTKNKPA